MLLCSMYVYTCGGQLLMSGISFYCPPPFLGDSLSLSLELTVWIDRLGYEPQGFSCFYLSSLGLQVCSTMPSVFCGCGGFKLRSSCLFNKHFTHSTISSVLRYMSFKNSFGSQLVESSGVEKVDIEG